MMDPIFARIREHSRQIASRLPTPMFYKDCSQAARRSRDFFETDPVIGKLLGFVADHLENDFGHGLDHAIKVTLDAGTLLIVEGQHLHDTDDQVQNRLRVVQSAGLLHDIQRKHKHHAQRGAEYARDILTDYPFSAQEIADIHCAIANHEAFTEPMPIDKTDGRLVSDCLYDADKFRWGPDNFTHTVWDMVSFSGVPLATFVALYPKAIRGLNRIRSTFRTPTGAFYGPEFIDLGLAIGDELLRFIRTEFAAELNECR
ncbi:MAG: hypothetical protein JEZ11_02575 [Desulfobacterales bacterium]|nr:hypothetical protein [Desulfobacterales bacterium]